MKQCSTHFCFGLSSVSSYLREALVFSVTADFHDFQSFHLIIFIDSLLLESVLDECMGEGADSVKLGGLVSAAVGYHEPGVRVDVEQVSTSV